MDDEAEFERFKMETRILKIREFHDEAALADIRLAQDIYDARKTSKSWRDSEPHKILEHEKRMMELQRVKEEERKVVVRLERDKRREEIKQRHIRSLPAGWTAAESPRQRLAQEVESKLKSGGGSVGASDPVIPSPATIRARRQSQSTVNLTSRTSRQVPAPEIERMAASVPDFSAAPATTAPQSTPIRSQYRPTPEAEALAPVAKYEPDDEWKESLRTTIQIGFQPLIQEAQERLEAELQELNEKGLLSESPARALCLRKFQEEAASIRKLAREQFEADLAKERVANRLALGGPVSPTVLAGLEQEQSGIWERIQRSLPTAGPTSSSRSPPTAKASEQIAKDKKASRCVAASLICDLFVQQEDARTTQRDKKAAITERRGTISSSPPSGQSTQKKSSESGSAHAASGLPSSGTSMRLTLESNPSPALLAVFEQEQEQAAIREAAIRERIHRDKAALGTSGHTSSPRSAPTIGALGQIAKGKKASRFVPL
jgi:hypothetical protein